jgi:hypothetical protein
MDIKIAQRMYFCSADEKKIYGTEKNGIKGMKAMAMLMLVTRGKIRKKLPSS